MEIGPCARSALSKLNNRTSKGPLLVYFRRTPEFATLEWVDWFNNRRLLEPIGNIPPAEFEQEYYCSHESHAMAA
jgi:transposase InsO family protein